MNILHSDVGEGFARARLVSVVTNKITRNGLPLEDNDNLETVRLKTLNKPRKQLT